MKHLLRSPYGLLALAGVLAIGCSKSTPAPTEATSASGAMGAAGASGAGGAAAEGDQADDPGGGAEGEGDDPNFAVATNAASGARGAAMVAEASRVLSTMTESMYSHHTHIDGTVYDVDCSGFVDYLLARTDPPALDELRAATVHRPLAKHYVELFSEAHDLKRWEPVARVTDLTAGDVLAWKKPEEVKGKNTGHVMLVAEPPRLHRESVWLVPIFDASASAHGRSDTRKASHASGVGRGLVLLEADAGGRPVAYYWSDASKSRRYATQIAMGKLR